MEGIVQRLRGVDRATLVASLTGSDTGRAAGLGAAVIAVNVVALVFTVVFARVLGASDYGSLAALISAFIILMVPGSALQIATARVVSHAVAVGDPMAGSGIRRWLLRLTLATMVVALAAIPLRSFLGGIINVEELWAAAAVPVTAMLWMLVSVERGALQGFQRYRVLAWSLVGESVVRLLFAILLVAAGLDVTGAFVASALSIAAVALVLLAPLNHHLPAVEPDDVGRLRSLLARSWAPVAALTLLFALQEVHIIVVKHVASGDDAGSYAVAAVAAKAIIWVAIGLGMYLLPEAARRARLGVDARPILLRTLGLIGVAAVPMVLLYAMLGRQLLSAVFGEDLIAASDALPWLGLAMTLLACAYLCALYLLALGRAAFIWILAAVALAEVVVLAAVGADLTGVAIALFCLQVVCATSMLITALRHVRATARAEDYAPV